jgi:dTDP-glucose pyrophosphorylase
MKFQNHIIRENFTLKNALEHINSLSSLDSLTLFIVDASKKLIGTLTDGDIRRSLVDNALLNDLVGVSMNTHFKYILQSNNNIEYISEAKLEGIGLMPIVNENFQILKIVDLNKIKSLLPIEAVIMAGGEGKRLKPLTLKVPKPLLKIGDKPILEYNVDLLNSYGVEKITISINYLGDQIKTYFSDGAAKELKIDYIEEKLFLGTIGSVSLVEDFIKDYFLVMNSDLLTNIDLEDFYLQVLKTNALMGVATIPYKVNLPYGVIESEDNFVTSLKEKPTYTYYSNAGIYIIHKSLKKDIPYNTFFNATDLIDLCLYKKIKVLNYPVLSYWLDIGKHEDYSKAQEDIKHLKF